MQIATRDFEYANFKKNTNLHLFTLFLGAKLYACVVTTGVHFQCTVCIFWKQIYKTCTYAI